MILRLESLRRVRALRERRFVILRRIVLSLVLVLFAFVTIGVVVGLDDATRRALVARLEGSGSRADPSLTAAPAPPRTSSPEPTPAGPNSSTRAFGPTAVPTAVPTSKPAPQPTSRSTIEPAPKVTARPRATPTKGATTKPPVKTSPASPNKAPTSAPPRGKNSAYLRGPLTKGRGGTVYLTFDDGPGPYTPQVLAILSRSGSTATFFQLGEHVAEYPALARQVRAQGSNIGNHTYDHPDLTLLKAKQVRWQIAHGPRSACFRPPYGAADGKVRKAIAAAGAREVRWDVDTFDWSQPGVKKLALAGRLKAIRAGSIVLMHDGGGDRRQTVAALPTIIADLQARGFTVRALRYCG